MSRALFGLLGIAVFSGFFASCGNQSDTSSVSNHERRGRPGFIENRFNPEIHVKRLVWERMDRTPRDGRPVVFSDFPAELTSELKNHINAAAFCALAFNRPENIFDKFTGQLLARQRNSREDPVDAFIVIAGRGSKQECTSITEPGPNDLILKRSPFTVREFYELTDESNGLIVSRVFTDLDERSGAVVARVDALCSVDFAAVCEVGSNGGKLITKVRSPENVVTETPAPASAAPVVESQPVEEPARPVNNSGLLDVM